MILKIQIELCRSEFDKKKKNSIIWTFKIIILIQLTD